MVLFPKSSLIPKPETVTVLPVAIASQFAIFFPHAIPKYHMNSLVYLMLLLGDANVLSWIVYYMFLPFINRRLRTFELATTALSNSCQSLIDFYLLPNSHCDWPRLSQICYLREECEKGVRRHVLGKAGNKAVELRGRHLTLVKEGPLQ